MTGSKTSNIDMSRVVTAEARARAEALARRGAEQAEARELLARTDWYVLRAAETGTGIPDEIQAARAAARRRASGPGPE